MQDKRFPQSMLDELGSNADVAKIWEWLNRHRPMGLWMCMYDDNTYVIYSKDSNFAAYVKESNRRKGLSYYAAYDRNPIMASSTRLHSEYNGAKVEKFSQPIFAFKLALELMVKRLMQGIPNA